MNMLHLVIFAQKVLSRITVTSDKKRNNNKTIEQAAWNNFGKMFRISLMILYISTRIYAGPFPWGVESMRIHTGRALLGAESMRIQAGTAP